MSKVNRSIRLVLAVWVVVAACVQEATLISSNPVYQQENQAMNWSWGPPVNDLVMGVAQDGVQIVLSIKNLGAKPQSILDYVATGGKHFDWYRFVLRDHNQHSRSLILIDNRDRSAPIPTTLAPQESTFHRIDLVEWARRLSNGSQPLLPGTYQLNVEYNVDTSANTWRGQLYSGAISFVVE